MEGNISNCDDKDIEYVQVVEEDVQPHKTQHRNLAVWKYFVKMPPEAEKTAKCNFCQQVRSYRTSVTNLKTHLSLKHPEVIEQDHELLNGISSNYQKKSRGQTGVPRKYTRKMELYDLETDSDNDTQNYTNDIEATTDYMTLPSEIWRHFDVEDDESICGLCRQTIPATLEDMKNHLEERHSDVLENTSQKVLETPAEDNNMFEDDDMYTDVVYLEDQPKKTVIKSEKPKQKQPRVPTLKTERNPSSSSDELVRKPKRKKLLCDTNKETQLNDMNNSKHDELKTFVDYITVLLKKVPNDLSQQLHLNILNLIMNATQSQNKSLEETGNFNNTNVVSTVADKSIELIQNVVNTSMINSEKLSEPLQILVPQTIENHTSSQMATSSTRDKYNSTTRKICISGNSISTPEVRVISSTNTRSN